MTPGAALSSPAALRNRGPIADVLADWLPRTGLVLEVASGTGEHATFFADRFPGLAWQPSDLDQASRESIRARASALRLPNLLPPLMLDCARDDWPLERADAIIAINMVHISPWQASLGLIAGASRLLPPFGPLILYGPWIEANVDTAPSNAAFDASLRERDASWGLREVTLFTTEAKERGLELVERRAMPANNIMLLFRRAS